MSNDERVWLLGITAIISNKNSDIPSYIAKILIITMLDNQPISKKVI